MPYIAKEDRAKFQPLIANVLGVMGQPNTNHYMKGEFFGYFVNRIARKFVGSSDYNAPAFNSTSFNESNKKALDNAADSIVVFASTEPMSAAGELNYCISAIYWGFIGSALGFEPAKYGMRAYLNGIINKVISQMDAVNPSPGNHKDATMTFRRLLIIRGVLDHVKEETYRIKTARYENQKIEENGVLWTQDGALNLDGGTK